MLAEMAFDERDAPPIPDRGRRPPTRIANREDQPRKFRWALLTGSPSWFFINRSRDVSGVALSVAEVAAPFGGERAQSRCVAATTEVSWLVCPTGGPKQGKQGGCNHEE